MCQEFSPFFSSKRRDLTARQPSFFFFLPSEEGFMIVTGATGKDIPLFLFPQKRWKEVLSPSGDIYILLSPPPS